MKEPTVQVTTHAESPETDTFESELRRALRGSTPAPGLVPDTFLLRGRFHIHERLGSGGMGSVYRATDNEAGKDVALKTLHVRGPGAAYNIKKEFRVLCDVVHPNLIELHELHVDDSSTAPVWFFTMRLIEGNDFVSAIRQTNGCNYAALEQLLPQVVSGVNALHASSKLHRDIKPSNVLVDASNRVTLLDFGVVRDLFSDSDLEESEPGTPAYMAPEVLMGQPASMASDWYGVGVLLFETLTGTLPRALTGQRASSLSAGVPPALDTLCADLLQLDAGARPTGEQLASRLDVTLDVPVFDTHRSFVGRKAELVRLKALLSSAQPGAPKLVHIIGPSGIGKTALAREFATEVSKDQRAFVLWNRCYEREGVPFKAVDAIVDRLSDDLTQMSAEQKTQIADDFDAAVRVFPILARAQEAISFETSLGEELARVRERGFAALGRIIEQLAAGRPVVLTIDDAQWADTDSAKLLITWLSRRWSVPLFVMFTHRESLTSNDSFLGLLRERLGSAWAETPDLNIVLGPLDDQEAQALVDRIIGDGLADPNREASLRRAVRGVGGLPLFVCELARQANSAQSSASLTPSLHGMLDHRMSLLTHPAVSLLEVLAVVGRPIEQATALAAAGLAVADRSPMRVLSSSHLIVANVAGNVVQLETAHDRIREGVVERLRPERLHQLHGAVANVLERAAGVEPEALLVHYLGSEQWIKARTTAEEAAHRAERAFAFERAAALYQQAYDLTQADTERWPLAERVGRAFANAGRGALAGAAFERAAAALQTCAPEQTAALLRLRTQAAEHYLQGVRDTDGLRVIKSVLQEHDIQYPASHGRMLFELMRHRMRLVTRGFGFEPSSANDAATNARLESLWVASKSLAFVNSMPATLFSVMLTLHAFKAGHAGYLARGLSMVATQEAMLESAYLYKRADRLAELVLRIARESGSEYELGYYHLSRAGTCWFQGRFPRAVEHAQQAHKLFSSLGRGMAYEVAVSNLWGLHALGMTGDLLELAERTAEARRDAHERADLFGERNAVVGPSALVGLAADEPELTRDRAEAAMAQVQSEVAVHNYHLLVTRVQIEWYEGRYREAWEHIARAWPWISAAFFDKMACLRDELLQLRAHAALALASALGEDEKVEVAGNRVDRRRLLKTARADMKAIASHSLPLCAPFAALLEASIARVEANDGKRERDALLRAIKGFDAAGMALHREASRWHLARCEGTADAPLERAASERWFVDQQVVRPERLVRTIAPGLG